MVCEYILENYGIRSKCTKQRFVFYIHSAECLLLSMHIHVAVYITEFVLALLESRHCSYTVAACRISLSSFSGRWPSFWKKQDLGVCQEKKKSKVNKLENNMKIQYIICSEKFEKTHFSHWNFINLSQIFIPYFKKIISIRNLKLWKYLSIKPQYRTF